MILTDLKKAADEGVRLERDHRARWADVGASAQNVLLVAEALAFMNNATPKVTCLFVVDPQSARRIPLGILHVHDCLRAGLR